MFSPLIDPHPVSPSLRGSEGVVVLFYLALLIVFGLFLGQKWEMVLVYGWVGSAGILLALHLWILHRYLPLNYRMGENNTLPTLGWGSQLTLSRGAFVSLMGGFLFLPKPTGEIAWMPALFYTIAAIIDVFDGYAARRTNHATRLGETLDVEFDTIGIVLVSLLAVWYGNLPFWFLILPLGRYLFMLGQSLRSQRGKSNRSLTPSRYRRIAAGLFMAFLTVMLWPIVRPPISWIGGVVFALPYTVIFIRDWLVVSEQIDPSSDHYQKWWGRSTGWLVSWLPIILRLILVGLVLRALISGYAPDWMRFLQLLFGLEMPAITPLILNLFTLIMTFVVASGVLTHFTAIWFIFAASGSVLTGSLEWHNGLLLAIACALTILGGGKYALWEPETEGLYHRRLGERH